MSNLSRTVKNTAEKLGLKDNILLRQTEEYLRVLQTKGSLALNDVAKTILCLDLACTSISSGFDKETAYKLSGLKKSAYQNSLHTIQKLLDLDKPVTINELCVQLNCTVIKEYAEQLYTSYSNNDNKIKDLAHPQYVSAAVYVACKLKNIKVEKSKLISVSRLKSSQWKDLVNEFEQFAESQGMVTSKKQGRTLENSQTSDMAQSNHEDPGSDNTLNTRVQETEPYEVWKKRILEEAYDAIAKNNAPVIIE